MAELGKAMIEYERGSRKAFRVGKKVLFFITMKKFLSFIGLFMLLSLQSKADHTDPDGTSAVPRWLKIVTCDAAGGFLGACEGSVIPGWGTAVGGILGGAAGSMSVARVAPPGGGTLPTVPSESLNEYSYVGQRHNEILKDYFSKNAVAGDVNSLVAFVNGKCTEYGMQTEGLNLSKFAGIAQDVATRDFSTASSLSACINSKLSSDYSKQIMGNVCNGIYNCHDIQTLNDFLRNQGKTIFIDTRISATDMAPIKIFFSTFISSANYWALNIP